MTQETIKPESVKEVLTVSEITAEQLYELNKAYNPSVWKETIERYARYKNCKFYLAAKQRGYDYDRYFAVYEIPEGIRFFQSVSYSSTLTNSGFCKVSIEDGIVKRILIKDAKGNEGYCANDAANRRLMARDSQMLATIFSNEF